VADAAKKSLLLAPYKKYRFGTVPPPDHLKFGDDDLLAAEDVKTQRRQLML